MSGRVAWIHLAPVKGCAVLEREEVVLERDGVRENRRFYVVDESGRVINAKAVPALLTVRPDYDERAGTLALAFPDETVSARVALGEQVDALMHGSRAVGGRLVLGPWSEALSRLAGRDLRLVQAEPGQAVDRGRGQVSLVSAAALDRLAEEAGVAQRVDGRRFRMLFGVDGIEAHAEDEWVGRRVQIGEAVVAPAGLVGRCAVTTCNPESGERDLDTLRVLAGYREPAEGAPAFGVYGTVVEPGRVRLGDEVTPL